MNMNVPEARRFAQSHVSDGCTELTCVYHGEQNQAIATFDVRKIRKTCVIVDPIAVSVTWKGNVSDVAIAAFATHYMNESMGFPGHKVSRFPDADQAVVTIYRD